MGRRALKCDYKRYSLSGLDTTKIAHTYLCIYIITPREGSVFFDKIVVFDLNFDVVHAATSNRYTNGKDERLVNLGPIAFLNN